MDDKDISTADQLAAFLSDYHAGMWSRMVSRLVDGGVESADAMELVKTYILSQGTAPVTIRWEK